MTASRRLTGARSSMATRRSTVSPSVSISSGHEGRPLGTRRGGHGRPTSVRHRSFWTDRSRTHVCSRRHLSLPIPSRSPLRRKVSRRPGHLRDLDRQDVVIFYLVNTEPDAITVLALFHHAQARTAFDPDR